MAGHNASKITMELLEWLMPSFRPQWIPHNVTGYTLRHALLFRRSPKIVSIVLETIKNDHRSKMHLKRLYGPLVIWTNNPQWNFRDHVHLVESIEEAFSQNFDENISWKLFVQKEKNLALLICDSTLFGTFAETAGLISSRNVLRTPAIYQQSERPHVPLSLYIFQHDMSIIKCIAAKCGVSFDAVFCSVFASSLHYIDSSSTLIFGSKVMPLSSLPKDGVACLRYCAQEQKTVRYIETDAAVRLSISSGDYSDVLWHFSSSTNDIVLNIDVVVRSDTYIVSVSSTRYNKCDLLSLENRFVAKLTDLVMSLRIRWTDDNLSDAKMALQFLAICDKISK